MIINNTEKQILQKYYAERIKSLSQNLKEMIRQDKQTELDETIYKIKEAGERIVDIQLAYEVDHSREVEDGNEK